MKKLRLLITEKCNRNCEGCCNKNFDIKNLSVETDYTQYKEIYLTGGEPMLDPWGTFVTIITLRTFYSFPGKIFLYTAKIDDVQETLGILDMLDGLTVTLHVQKDVYPLYELTTNLRYVRKIKEKSLRLNVFDGIELETFDHDKLWKIKEGITWIKDCPLPEGEVFKRYKL